ncbi:MAG: TonB-dependent receptor-like protein [Sphingomonas bacterium]|uniref:TonB-dependent receptor domain-containing protein n=1 Tax=Sphingomonas bacterium TaxID=1895847 RepID=UPI002621B889|nr:TonB-dependent receptor [Sphingomonas bacterium]MDB5704367.1 TonB-dependent receptor-like protein [Sphingomonas bacterium]
MKHARYTSTICSAITLAMLFVSSSAFAQDAPKLPSTPPDQADSAATPQDDESVGADIVVTGTSIRGQAPVGSNLVTVGRDEIDRTAAQTVQQILKSVPSLSNLGQTSQGGGNTTPAIHNLGAVSSYSTLVLIDGHRFSLGRQQQPLPDPGILPPSAIERVEVLADGASSVYGSDAVAGVINFVTRKDYKGFQVSGQYGFGDDYNTYSANAIWGTRWDTGGVMVTGAYSFRSVLWARDRDFLNPNHIAQGGTNFGNYNCGPAVLQPGGAGNFYLSATATTSTPNVAANAPCSTYQYSSALPEDKRINAMVKLHQEVIENLTFSLDGVYSDRRSNAPQARGNIQVTTFGAGAQANPFYISPPGYTGAATSQVVRWNADDLLGPGAYSTDNSINYYVSSTLDYQIMPKWHMTALALYGHEDSITASYGTVCGSCANLALNGTTNSTGNVTQPSVPGSSTIILQLPLTAANALDVWNPTATNRTSAAVRAALMDNTTVSNWYYGTKQFRLGTDATLFTLPGGDLNVAAGIESVHYTLDINRTSPSNTGPSSSNSQYLHIPLARTVRSVFGEIFVPIFGPGNAMPFFQKLALNASIRYDDYSDVGPTTNPKVGVDWEPVNGIKLRANWASSFVAPQLSSVGDISRGGLTSFTCYGSSCPGITLTQFSINTADFPGAIGLPGCTAGMVTCVIPTTVGGVVYNSGPANPKPSKGRSWSVGFDVTPSLVPGLRLSGTLFNVKYIDFITGTSLSNAITTPSLDLIHFFPAGATPAQIAATVPPFAQLQGTLPTTVYYLVSARQGNFNNLDVRGIDASFNYSLPTGSAGTFNLGATWTHFLKFNQKLKGGQQYSILNTTGINSTFGAVQDQGRLNLGWEMGGFGLDAYGTVIGSYKNWSSGAVNPVTTAGGIPTGGGDEVKASLLIDLNLRYTLPDGGLLGGSTLFVDTVNLFNKDPAFYNSANGYDSYTGNPTGRVVTVGVRAKF